MNKAYGSQSMIAPLRKVLVKRPDEAFAVADADKWHYTDRPNLERAQQEHDGLAALLRQAGAEVVYHDAPQPDHADAIYVYDPAIVTDRGAIMLSLLWLDHDTLAVGLGFRTNAEGLRQLREALSGLGVSVLPVELPYYQGPVACLHLLSLISIVDHKLAVVYPPLLSVPFWQYLRHERGFRLLEVPPQEFESMGTNVLALAPGRCLMLEGNPVTQQRLIEAGCEVLTYRGHEISLKAEGGPTCLTRPILRGEL
jgi:dimethylargininase